MKTKIAQQEKGIGIPRRGVANTGQPCTYQKPQLIKSPGVIHALGKAEIPGEEVELNPASPWWARKESHRSVQAGGVQEDGNRLQGATGEVNMPHIRNKAGSLPNPVLWLQRLGEDTAFGPGWWEAEEG